MDPALLHSRPLSACRLLPIHSVFVLLQQITVLLVSIKKGNSSHSVAELSNVLINEGHTHANTHPTITNSQLWLMEGVHPRFKKARAQGEYVPKGQKKEKKECERDRGGGGGVVSHNGV